MIDHRQVSRAIGAALTVASALVGASSAAQAQSTPQIATVPRASAPTPPSEMWALCTPNPNTGAPADTCPVIQYGGFTTWAFAYKDNRVAYGLVSYDAQGTIVKTAQLDGARYIYKMTVDPAAKTVDLWGQSNARVDVAWTDLPQPPAPSGPGVYSWTSAAAPPVNAVVAPSGPAKAICRAADGDGATWVGWWDGAACNGSYAGNKMPASKNPQFLVQVSGAPQWTPPTPSNSLPSIPPGAISGGPTFNGYNQIVCAYEGYIGWIYIDACEQSGTREGGGISVLTGTLQ